jgi:hypothetical protein
MIAIIASVGLAMASAFDGYYTYRAQKKGAIEVGPAKIIYGPHPAGRDLLLKGGAVIAIEIAAALIATHCGLWFLSLPLFVQSGFHVWGARTNIEISGF